MSWVFYALVGAFAAGVTAILAKIGVAGIPSNLATAVRTFVVLAFVTALVAVRGEHAALRDVRGVTWAALILSGLATGVSWLAYFKALQLAPASWVAPLDKLSLPITVLLAVLFLGETFTWRTAVGITLMLTGALVIARG